MKKVEFSSVIPDIREEILSGLNLNTVTDNIFIVYHRKSDNFPLMCKLHKWTALQNSGEIASGVAVFEGGRHIVVSPTQPSALFWSSAAIAGGGFTSSDRVLVLNDWEGKTNTASQVAASTEAAITNTSEYAPGYCNLYSRPNANNAGLTAGKWWMPSMGELMMIYANLHKINHALTLINGSNPLLEADYWSSTEHSAPYAWFLNLTSGYMGAYSKATDRFNVRPVSAFIG
ncbi:hypothetical protein [Petrimonas sp.]|uniref:hypothetical protein n=1 Tax=Petrimonas sp. TaxID=2023866 RepID=UPI002FC9F323